MLFLPSKNQVFTHLHYCSFHYIKFKKRKEKGKRVSYLLAFSVSKLPLFLFGRLTGSKLNSYWNTADRLGNKDKNTKGQYPAVLRLKGKRGFTCRPRMFGRGLGSHERLSSTPTLGHSSVVWNL